MSSSNGDTGKSTIESRFVKCACKYTAGKPRKLGKTHYYAWYPEDNSGV